MKNFGAQKGFGQFTVKTCLFQCSFRFVSNRSSQSVFEQIMIPNRKSAKSVKIFFDESFRKQSVFSISTSFH